MSPSIIGGILLILGSFFVYKGDIFKSVFVFFCADLCWCFLAFSTGDMLGFTLTLIGMILGLLAFLKMHLGEFSKTIKK